MLERIKQAVIEGDAPTTVELVRQAVEAGLDPEVIVEEALAAGLRYVGDLFDKGEYFVPEMMISADAMQKAMEVLQPLLAGKGGDKAGVVVMGTIKGDLHDIGKNLVITMLRGTGFDVIDLGVDVATVSFVEAVREHGAGVVGIGALITTVLPAMQDAVAELKGLDPPVRVMIGGAAVTEELGQRFGADGYAPNAKAAADLAGRLLKEKPAAKHQEANDSKP